MVTITLKTVDGKYLVLVKDAEGKLLSHLSTYSRKEVPGLIKKAQTYYPDAKLTA